MVSKWYEERRPSINEGKEKDDVWAQSYYLD